MDATEVIESVYRAWGKGDIPTLMSLMHPQLKMHAGGHPVPGLPMIGTFRGPDGLRDYLGALNATVSVKDFRRHRILADADRVVVEGFTRSVVNETGKPYEIEWVMTFSVVDGKVETFSHYYDTAAVLRAFEGGD